MESDIGARSSSGSRYEDKEHRVGPQEAHQRQNQEQAPRTTPHRRDGLWPCRSLWAWETPRGLGVSTSLPLPPPCRNTASRGPPQPAPSRRICGNGFNLLSQLMSAMGGNANLGAMPALPAHAMREEAAFLSSNGSAPQPSLPDAVAQREPEPPLPQQAPPPILPFTSLYSVKVRTASPTRTTIPRSLI